jgi:hypothetical protein
MKIEPSEIKIPLKKTVSTLNGETEVSLSAMDKKETGVYKSYMSCCAMDDHMFVNTAGMDKTQTMNTCANHYGKVQDMLNEESDAGSLTPAQKKLPPALQKAILKKMGSKDPETNEGPKHEGGETKNVENTEDAQASGQKTKTLSKDDKVDACPTCGKTLGKKDMMNTCADCKK